MGALSLPGFTSLTLGHILDYPLRGCSTTSHAHDKTVTALATKKTAPLPTEPATTDETGLSPLFGQYDRFSCQYASHT